MNKFKLINGEGIGKTLDEKLEESAIHYEVDYVKVEGALAGYGSREYAIIETDQDLSSEFMQSLRGCKVIELNTIAMF